MGQAGRLPGMHEDLDSIPRGVTILNKQIKVKRETLLYSVRGSYVLKIPFIFFIYVGSCYVCVWGVQCVWLSSKAR